ncbi:MAG: hypothetical protein HQ541_07685, partial [Mariniphaga sp.]|nr:hypothetical protein [Mariniphaga sp.]
TSSLSAGSYTGYLKITSNGGGATHPAAMVNIVSPDLCLSEATKDFGEISQGSIPDPNTFTFSIENCGKGILSGNITISEEWLSVSPNSFSLNESQNKTFTVTATTNGLLPGDFTSNITVTSNGGNSSWQIAKIKVLSYKPVFTFVDNSKLFGAPTIFKNSTAYIYGYLEEDNSPSVGSSFSFNINSNNENIPAGVEYLGNGILKLWLSLDENINQSNLQISLSGTVSNNGTEISFDNIPDAFNAQVQNTPINQSIDIFAGGSVGVKLIAGGVGAGPSVAAASLSLNGTGGMGINFHQDSEGNEFITRRFEAGVGVSVETPSINAVVGDIQTGVSANVMVKGVMGQTMYFPNNLNTEIVQKAKAAYILETFTMGGIELSPFASIFLQALKNSLVNANPDLNAIYSDLYYSNQTGTAVEGEVSAGFSVSTGDDSNDEMDLFEVSGHTTLSKQFSENLQNNNRSLKFGYAAGFELAALDFEYAGVDFGNQFEVNFGTDFSLGANYNPVSGINSFELSFGATATRDYTIASFSDSYSYNFLIPKSLILKNQESDNIIGSVAPSFIPELPKKRFKVGMNYYTQNLDELYSENPDNLESFNDHIIMGKVKSSTKGIEVDAKVGLDAVLGVGAGLKLGIHFSYLDEMYYPKSEYIVAHNQILPIAEYNDIPDEQRLFSIQDEIHDVFQGTVLLIKEPLNELLNVIENQIESNLAFVIKILDGEAELRGIFSESGLKWITRTSNPTTKSVHKNAFLEPQVINAYSSRRIIHLNNKSAGLAEEEEE